MSAADEFRAIAEECRVIPGEFGLREHAVSIVVIVPDGGLPWLGDETLTETPILVGGTQNPKVRFPTQREMALVMMSEGSVTVGPFTPLFGPGGIDRSDLDGSKLATGDGFLVRITGPQHPNGCLYRVKNSNVDRALRIVWTLVPAEGN